MSSRFTHLRTVKYQLEFIVATSSQRLVSVAFYSVNVWSALHSVNRELIIRVVSFI